MNTPETSQDVLDTLSPHELAVLRRRFGLTVEVTKPTSVTPPRGDNGSSGSGGVPAPAKPPS